MELVTIFNIGFIKLKMKCKQLLDVFTKCMLTTMNESKNKENPKKQFPQNERIAFLNIGLVILSLIIEVRFVVPC